MQGYHILNHVDAHWFLTDMAISNRVRLRGRFDAHLLTLLMQKPYSLVLKKFSGSQAIDIAVLLRS